MSIDHLSSLPRYMKYATEMDMAEAPDGAFRLSTRLQQLAKRQGSRDGVNTYHLCEDKAVLKKPCLFHCSFHQRIVSGTVDLRGSLTQSNENILNFDMRVGAVANGCRFQELSKQQRILANSLNRLIHHQSKFIKLNVDALTLTRRSPMVRAFFEFSL